MNQYHSHRPRRNRLYRSRDRRLVAGVCGGLAEHFNFSVAGVRLLVILLALVTGPGLFIWLLLYAVMAFMLREQPLERFTSTEQEEFWNLCQSSRPAALATLRRRFEALETRLQRMETIVTRPDFDLRDQYRNL